MTALAALAAAAIVYLLAAYAIGGPVLFARRVMTAFGRRRLRYRPPHDDAVASSRFTIPVSVILPTDGEESAAAAAERLLTLNYPEFEVIVVNDGSLPALAALRERFDLHACEIFYRRSIGTSPVRAIYRSATQPRLLVLDCATGTRGDALNCGVNIARYRYVCCADRRARYDADALLESMHPAVEDPALVVGVTTTLGPPREEPGEHAAAPPDVWTTFARLSAARALLSRSGGRNLSLSSEGLPGLALWRRDTLIEVGGFAADIDAEQVELTFRMHRHHLRDRRPYRILHIAEPVGAAADDRMLGQLVAWHERQQRSMGAVLWRYRALMFNPQYGSLGTIDLPRYVFSRLVVPWLELMCLAALPLTPLLGVLTPLQLLFVLAALAFGNGILLNTALLMAPPGTHDEDALRRSILLAPLELFVSRPAQLYSRLAGMLRMFARSASAPVG